MATLSPVTCQPERAAAPERSWEKEAGYESTRFDSWSGRRGVAPSSQNPPDSLDPLGQAESFLKATLVERCALALGVAFEARLCHGPLHVATPHVASEVRLGVQYLLGEEHLQSGRPRHIPEKFEVHRTHQGVLTLRALTTPPPFIPFSQKVCSRVLWKTCCRQNRFQATRNKDLLHYESTVAFISLSLDR